MELDVSASPAVGGVVDTSLDVPVRVALCGGLTGSGTIMYYEGFEKNPVRTNSMDGTYSIVPKTQTPGAFRGKVVRAVLPG